MAGADGSAYLAAVRWGEESQYPREYGQKVALPQVAKIIKGQYLNLGVPSLPSPSLSQVVLLDAGGKKIKVAAQCVKFKEGRRVVPVGPKLAIPDSYEGWFEILSEDGRAVRCIETVAELSKRFPESCLVRENIKAFLPKNEDGDAVADKTRILTAGEVLVLVGEVLASLSRGRSPSRFLRCFTSKAETVFLSLDHRGKFSPIAGEDNISGVHRIKNFLSKRFPLMVRLVHGKPPAGLKPNSNLVPEMRLYSLFEEECIMAMPLLKDAPMIALPLTAPLKLLAPRNVDVLVKLKEYGKLVERCQAAMQEISDRIQVFDISLGKELRSDPIKIPNRRHHHHKRQHHPTHVVKRSFSDPQGVCVKNGVVLEREMSTPAGAGEETDNDEVNADDRRYDEIDQIYDYVRGFAPLPERIKSDFESEERMERVPSPKVPIVPPASPTEPKREDDEEAKPEPPPIDTIPIRKVSLSAMSGSLPSQRITVNIVNASPMAAATTAATATGLRPWEVTTQDKTLVQDHIYEKVGKRCEDLKNGNLLVADHHPPQQHHMRVPVRSSSAGKIYIQNTHHPLPSSVPVASGNNKLFLKSPAQQRSPQKPRFFKHCNKSANPVGAKDAGGGPKNSRTKMSRSKSLTTSPLFNIRYKSLTNLAIDFNTLDSSNSGGQTSSGSGETKDYKDYKHRNRKIPRPKSLTNLFWDLNHVDHYNKYNLLQNELNVGNKNDYRKFIFSHDPSPPCNKIINPCSNKRIGTLYL